MMSGDDDLNAAAARLGRRAGRNLRPAISTSWWARCRNPSRTTSETTTAFPYEGLEDYLYVFDSDYYREMIDRANLTNPTQATSTGLELSYQFACINRALTHCKLAEWFSERVEERTNGQLVIEIIGYPELGIAGPDILELLTNGTLSFAELPAAYTAGDLPAMDMKYLWGMYPDNETFYNATVASIPDLDKLIERRTEGGVTIFQLWRVPENEIFFFSKEPIEELEDFEGLKVRSFGGALSDMIDGMGSEAQWVAFTEVYTALERGILDGGRHRRQRSLRPALV